MAVEYTETSVPPGDTRDDVLGVLAGGKPWVLVIADVGPDSALNLKVEAGGGISDTETIRNLLTKTLDALL